MKKNKEIIMNAQEDVLRHLLVGKSVDKAKHLLDEIESKHYLRVTKENGVNYMVTCDFVPNRINVYVDNGIITEIDGLG